MNSPNGSVPPPSGHPWHLAGRDLTSRLIVGTGGAPSLDVLGKVRTFERGAQPRLPLHTRCASLAPDDRAHCIKEDLHTICIRSTSRLHPCELMVL